jgi:peptidylprolyl isomerase
MSDQVQTPETQSRATTAEAAAHAKRRAGAIGGALAGVAVIAVLVAVFVFVQLGGDDTPATPAAAPPPAATEPSAPPQAEQPAAPPAGIDPALGTKPQVKAGSGDVKALKVTPLVKGTGPAVKAGQQLTVNYVGVTYGDGKEFDSSWNSGQPVTFPIGTGNLIKGWDEGLIGVPVGSRVQLDIPADMAYGEKPTGGQPAGDLRFVVDVLQAA